MRRSPAEVCGDAARRSLSLDRLVGAGNRRKTCSERNLFAVRRSRSVNDFRTTHKSIPVSFQRSGDAQASTIHIENEASNYGRRQPEPHTAADDANFKARDNPIERFFSQKVFSRLSLLPRLRSPSTGRRPPEEGHISRNRSVSRHSERVEGEELSNECTSQGGSFYDGPSKDRMGIDLGNRYNYTASSASPPPTVSRKQRNQPRERSMSPQLRERIEVEVSKDLELLWINNLKTIKKKQSKAFKEMFGSYRISDEQWMTAFNHFRNYFLEVAEKITNDIDFEGGEDPFENTELHGIPSDVYLNTTRKFIKRIKYAYARPKRFRDIKKLEVWLIDELCEAFCDEFVRSGVGSEEDFDLKWERVSDRNPDMENDLNSALDEMEGLLRKWIDPRANVKDARAALESLFEDRFQLKGQVLVTSGADFQGPIIVISAAHPDLGAIFERVHILDKKVDRVLYGMPIGKKSEAFLASQELGVIDYFKCDEVNVSRRSMFAAVDFGLSDRSTGVQLSKSARKAKLYYDLILEASSMDEQSWLHEQLSKHIIGHEDRIDPRFIDKKWKTLKEFFKNAEPKAKRISDLCQAPKSKNTEESSLRRRQVRRSSRSETFQERAVPESFSGDKLNIVSPDPEGLPNNERGEKRVIEHLLSFVRHIRQRPSRKVALAFLVDRKTVLVLLPCFIALSAVFTGVSLVTNTSDPNTSNFYEQLSTLSQMLFSLYCLMVPLIRASNPIAWSFWLSLAVAMSATAGVLSVALFYYNGQASISFSFVSGTAQIVATMLLIEGVDEVVRRPRMEFSASPRDESLGFGDERNRAHHRTRDEEAFDFALPVVGQEQVLRDVFYKRL